jgi:hypothetical protein
MSTRKLSVEAQTFVVQALACFDSPLTVAQAVRARFGVDIAPQSIEAYDPTKHAGSEIPKRWRMLFEETRARLLAEVASIGIAHRAVRLRALDRMAAKAESMGAITIAAAMHEQAAKEVGDCFTNRQRHEVLVPQATITLHLAGDRK